MTIEEQIEEAIKDGLSNHTGEWFNGFIAPGLSLNEEQLRDLLLYITKAKRLNKNIQDFITKEIKQAREDEVHRFLSRSDSLSEEKYATRRLTELNKD